MITYIVVAIIVYIAYIKFMGSENARLLKDTRQKTIKANLIKSNYEATKRLEEVEKNYENK